MNAIGVFDSGVGGLTVLDALVRAFPQENFVYLADTARLPYGSKTIDTIHNYLKQNVAFLERQQVKAVVVACNSASTALLQFGDSFSLPVFNVIEPGARVAVAHSQSQRIGVLGTRATVLSQAYPQAIHRLNPKAVVSQVPAPLLVPLVEEGWLDDPITNLIVYRYLSTVLPEQPDTLILGCTHYPALRQAIARACPPSLTLIDSTTGLIEDLKNAYDSGALAEPRKAHGFVRILCTDLSPRLQDLAELLLKSATPEGFEQVDI